MYTIENLTDNILNLSDENKVRFFKLISTEKELIDKIMPDLPLMKFVMFNLVDSSTASNPLIQQYIKWKESGSL